MDSKGLGGSGGSVGVITEIVDISRSQGNAKPLWPSIGAALGDQMIAVHAPEQNMWNMTSDAECPLSSAQASGFLGTNAREDFDVGTSNSFLSQVTGGKQLHRRSGKVVRSNSGSSKRSRIVQIEVSLNETGVEDVKEKPQITRQKSTANGKQRDKRNGKLSKSRIDPFSLKNGLVSFSSVAGGGNFLAYGCKSGTFDATNHVDELPLDELLDGSYTCQSLVKDKGKAVQIMDDNNLLNSFRKAFSVLQLQSHVPSQKTVELEHDNDQKTSACSTADACSPESRTNGGSEAICASNQPSINKDCIARKKVVSTLDDSPLYEPKDVLNLLMLPTPKELDNLLLDAVMKPASSSKNSNDLRLGKTLSHRTGLPPFHWSLNPSGHSKSGPDAFKLAANRPSCQGRWLKVENTLTSPKVSNTGFLEDFETLCFDNRLVPVVSQQYRPLEKKNAASLVSNEQAVSSSSPTCSASQVPLAEHSSSGLLAAAETLYEISSYSSKEDTHDTFAELRKCQKPMKTSKLKPDGKSGRLATPASAPPSMGSENLHRKPDGTYPSKKLKFSPIGHAESARHSKHAAAISPMNWSAPRSIRSSTGGKSLKDSVPQSKKNPRSSNLKKSYMMMPPPSSRFIDKASSGNNQLRLKDKLQREMN